MANFDNQCTVTASYDMPDGTTRTGDFVSNVASVENISTVFLKSKSLSATYAMPSQEIEQTLVLYNNSSVEISDVKILDTIGIGAFFDYGSLTIDGEPYPYEDITMGVTLSDSIAVGNSVTIRYTMVMEEHFTTSTAMAVSNVTYTADGAKYTENSNSVRLSLLEQNILVQHSTLPAVTMSKQGLTIQNIISNQGNIRNTDLVLTNPIPAGTTFVPNSVRVDDVERTDADPSAGIALADLAPGDSIDVTFVVVVD